MVAVQFSEPVRLWLLVALAGLLAAYVAVQFTRRKYAVRFTNLALLDKVAPKGPGLRRHAVAAGFLLCVGLQVLAFAGPRRVERVPRERATVMLAIDTSLSMQATDVQPSRIAGAKEAAKTFLAELPAKFNVGLVSFSRKAELFRALTPSSGSGARSGGCRRSGSRGRRPACRAARWPRT